MPETAERPRTCRANASLFEIVILLRGGGLPIIGYQIQPCYGEGSRLFDRLLGKLVEQALITYLTLVTAMKEMSIAISGGKRW